MKRSKKRQKTKMKRSRKAKVDPVLAEIVRSGVMAVTEEMKTKLMRTAYNMIIYEALDFTVGLFTAGGGDGVDRVGLPIFIRGMAETVKAKIEKFGHKISIRATSMSPTMPISPAAISIISLDVADLPQGVVFGFSCCMAHWLDIGGSSAA